MTTPGPDHFFSCPHCRTVLRRWTIGSGNTFDSTLWSDGYLDAPSLPRAVDTTRCPSCGKAFLVEDAEDLGEYWTCGYNGGDSETTLPQEYKDAPTVEDAKPDALLELILQTEDRDRLRSLCIQTWHIYNEAYRNSKPEGQGQRLYGLNGIIKRLVNRLRHLRIQIWREDKQTSQNPKFKEQVQRPADFYGNLERLIGVLDDDHGHHQIMKAEALRELGRYAEAIAALQYVDVELGWVAGQIRSMAQDGVSAVRILHRPD